MKRLNFEYAGNNYIAFIRRKYDAFCKATLFYIRPECRWYQFKLMYLDTVHFFLVDVKTKEDIIEKFCYHIQTEIDRCDRIDAATQLWRSL